MSFLNRLVTHSMNENAASSGKVSERVGRSPLAQRQVTASHNAPIDLSSPLKKWVASTPHSPIREPSHAPTVTFTSRDTTTAFDTFSADFLTSTDLLEGHGGASSRRASEALSLRGRETARQTQQSSRKIDRKRQSASRRLFGLITKVVASDPNTPTVPRSSTAVTVTEAITPTPVPATGPSSSTTTSSSSSASLSTTSVDLLSPEPIKFDLVLARRREQLQQINPTYIFNAQKDGLKANHRARAVHWLLEVAAQVDFQQDTLCLAVAVLDQFLALRSIEPRDILGYAVCALHLASKLEEDALSFSHYEFVAQGKVTVAELSDKERVMLETLNYNVRYETAAAFLPSFQTLANFASEKPVFAGYFILKLGLADYSLLAFWPSQVAASIVYLCRSLEGTVPVWPQTLIDGTGYTESALMACVTALTACLTVEASLSQPHSLSLEYAKEQYLQVSDILLTYFRNIGPY